MHIGEAERSALERRIASLEAERKLYEPDLRELEENFEPRRSRWTPTDRKRSKKRNSNIINGTPLWAVTVLKSGMMSGHTSPSRPWFKLITPDPGLGEVEGVRHWLYIVESRMREVFARSNVYNALPSCYGDLGVFGTTALGVYPDDRDTIRCYPYLIGSYAIANGARLSVDSFSRRWQTSVSSAVEQFGLNAVSDAVRDKYKTKHYDEPVMIHHLLQPNREADDRYLDSSKMPIKSVYWEQSFPANRALRVEGFRQMPVLVARWDTAGEDVWGDSPALRALGDSKQLQFDELRRSQILAQIANPAKKIDPSLKRGSDMKPGGKNYVSMTAGNPGIEPIYVPHPQAYQYATEALRELEGRVRQHLFTDVFMMMAESDRRQITAREVEERHAEKLLMLGPVLERLSDELLDPLIQRTFALMLEAGLVPEWPEELDGQQLKIEYISILAQAQKAVATQAVESVAAFTGSVAQFNPEVMDKFDADQAIDEYAQFKGAPPTIIRSDQAVAAIRQRRAQQQQAQQMAALAQQAAATAKDLGNTPTGEGSVLDKLVA